MAKETTRETTLYVIVVTTRHNYNVLPDGTGTMWGDPREAIQTVHDRIVTGDVLWTLPNGDPNKRWRWARLSAHQLVAVECAA